jgi:hypothetical protein
MSRKLSERLLVEKTPRSFVSYAAGILSIAALTACGATTSTADDTTTAQALTEAKSSEDDTRAAAKACFTTFEACRSAASADIGACKTALVDCLPAEAGAGPHCGPPPGKHPRGAKGEGGERGGEGGRDGCEGGPGADGPRPPDADPNGPPPPPAPGDDPNAGPPKTDPAAGAEPGAPPPPRPGEPGNDGSGRGDGAKDGAGSKPRGPDGGERPDFCDHVPLPPPPAIRACNEVLDACVEGGGDRKPCFEAHDTCVKTAFESARPAGK